MTKYKMITGVVLDSKVRVSFLDLCRQYHISEELLLELLEHGLLADINTPNKNIVFEQMHLQRILSAHRLHNDLGINPAGVILALELLDELEDLRRQLDILKRHIHS
ncbi:MAG TPA: chaperone modulator CbpM [Legionellaceae bacterium]|nr:chaperone modulator CbpM [Legionellaceae bacterium]